MIRKITRFNPAVIDKLDLNVWKKANEVGNRITALAELVSTQCVNMRPLVDDGLVDIFNGKFSPPYNYRDESIIDFCRFARKAQRLEQSFMFIQETRLVPTRELRLKLSMFLKNSPRLPCMTITVNFLAIGVPQDGLVVSVIFNERDWLKTGLTSMN